MIFLSSDHHFDHKNILSYCPGRPWKTIEEMNAAYVSLWNTTVSKDDTVFYLGDFSLSKSALHIVKTLNGIKYLIPGNHDSCFPGHKKFEKEIPKYVEAGFASVIVKPYQLENFLLWHLPYIGDRDGRNPEAKIKYDKWRPVNHGMILLHGHVHQHWKMCGRQINVGVDVWNNRPVSLEVVKCLAQEI